MTDTWCIPSFIYKPIFYYCLDSPLWSWWWSIQPGILPMMLSRVAHIPMGSSFPPRKDDQSPPTTASMAFFAARSVWPWPWPSLSTTWLVSPPGATRDVVVKVEVVEVVDVTWNGASTLPHSQNSRWGSFSHSFFSHLNNSSSTLATWSPPSPSPFALESVLHSSARWYLVRGTRLGCINH